MLPLFAAIALLGEIPAGFAPADEREVLGRMLEYLEARDWMVTLDRERLRVETREDWLKRELSMPRAKPDADGQTIHLANGRITWRNGQGTRVADGWIDGYDMGEFGGGLYWFSADGKKHKLISGSNTQLVIATPKGVFAVQGMNHMGFQYGKLVQIAREGGQWKERLIGDLHTMPMVIRDRNRFILGTDDYISTLETDGTQREIYRPRTILRGIGLQSMVRLTNGDIWIGANRGILRLCPTSKGDYTSQWFWKRPATVG